MFCVLLLVCWYYSLFSRGVVSFCFAYEMDVTLLSFVYLPQSIAGYDMQFSTRICIIDVYTKYSCIHTFDLNMTIRVYSTVV